MCIFVFNIISVCVLKNIEICVCMWFYELSEGASSAHFQNNFKNIWNQHRGKYSNNSSTQITLVYSGFIALDIKSILDICMYVCSQFMKLSMI